nr:calcium and integrin-binding protein 1-like [Leptinotarsa decemlineata]
MGSSPSSPVLTKEVMEEYLLLTYLSEREIFRLYTMLCSLCTVDFNGTLRNFAFRFPVTSIEQLFPELMYNPFKDRIFRVFSSLRDGKMSFEDLLDLCSVMSENCPAQVKAAYAFQIFDFDEDNCIGEQDLTEALNRLIGGFGSVTSSQLSRITDTVGIPKCEHI